MTGRTYRTTSGKILADDDIEAIAAEVATDDHDVALLRTRRRNVGERHSTTSEVEARSDHVRRKSEQFGDIVVPSLAWRSVHGTPARRSGNLDVLHVVVHEHDVRPIPRADVEHVGSDLEDPRVAQQPPLRRDRPWLLRSPRVAVPRQARSSPDPPLPFTAKHRRDGSIDRTSGMLRTAALVPVDG
jgi:hypothetical protein